MPTRSTSSPITTSAVNEKRRPPLTTLATRLISTTRSFNSLDSATSTAIRRSDLPRALPPLLQANPARRGERLAVRIVDELGEHALVRAEDGQPGPLRGTRDLAAHAAVPAEPGLAYRGRAHARFPTFRRTCSPS